MTTRITIQRYGLKCSRERYKNFLDQYFRALGADSYPARYVDDRRIVFLKHGHRRAIYNPYNLTFYLIPNPKEDT